jgi:hypothetical protein
MVAVVEEQLALNPPMVVDEVGVEEVHAPPLSGWRETAQEQDLGAFWQEWFQGVSLDAVHIGGKVTKNF